MGEPKTPVATVPINDVMFRKMLEEKGMNIKELGRSDDISCSELTIRHSLKVRKIKAKYLQEIAKKLGVGEEELTGLKRSKKWEAGF